MKVISFTLFIIIDIIDGCIALLIFSGPISVDELLRTFISGVFSEHQLLQSHCLNKIDELLQTHSTSTSIYIEDNNSNSNSLIGESLIGVGKCSNTKLRAIVRKRKCIPKILSLLKGAEDIELKVSAAGVLQVPYFSILLFFSYISNQETRCLVADFGFQ